MIKIPFKNKNENSAWQKKRYEERMKYIQQLKKESGGCKSCGWNFHLEILQFHHRDKNQKELKINGNNLACLSMEKINIEINKCDLLCPNCHYWLHYNEKDWFTKKAKNK